MTATVQIHGVIRLRTQRARLAHAEAVSRVASERRQLVAIDAAIQTLQSLANALDAEIATEATATGASLCAREALWTAVCAQAQALRHRREQRSASLHLSLDLEDQARRLLAKAEAKELAWAKWIARTTARSEVLAELVRAEDLDEYRGFRNGGDE